MQMFCVALLVAVASAQFLPVHKGDLETTISGYRLQYHDEFKLLMVMHAMDCYVSDVPDKSDLQRLLEDPVSRKEVYGMVIQHIESGKDISKTTLEDVHSQYADMLLRALCFRSELYKMDITHML